MKLTGIVLSALAAGYAVVTFAAPLLTVNNALSVALGG